jgi:ATP-dependent DNA helicase RecQ
VARRGRESAQPAAYVVFHDAALAEMAERCPDSLDALAEVGGVGARKLEAYGEEILRVLGCR